MKGEFSNTSLEVEVIVRLRLVIILLLKFLLLLPSTSERVEFDLFWPVTPLLSCLALLPSPIPWIPTWSELKPAFKYEWVV